MEEREINQREASEIVYKFSVMIVVFSVLILILCGIIAYLQQMRTYRNQCRQTSRDLGEYLEAMILDEGDFFLTYRDHISEYYGKELVPYDFKEFNTARKDFEAIFTEHYPGKVLGEDITYEDMDEEVQKAYLIYQQEYWTITFESARKAFDIPYTYFLIPNSETNEVIYMIDGERTKVEGSDGKDYLLLGDTYYNDPAKVQVEWATWESGKQQDEYQEWDNAWGHTYSYYVPVIVNGQKLGLIGTEADVEAVNKEILNNTGRQLLAIAVVLVICSFLLIVYIKRAITKQYEKYGPYM